MKQAKIEQFCYVLIMASQTNSARGRVWYMLLARIDVKHEIMLQAPWPLSALRAVHSRWFKTLH